MARAPTKPQFPLIYTAVILLGIELAYMANDHSLNALIPGAAGLIVTPFYLYFLCTRLAAKPYNLVNAACCAPILFLVITGVVAHSKSNSESVRLCQEAFYSPRGAIVTDPQTHADVRATDISQCSQ